jgi:hypothetical protein
MVKPLITRASAIKERWQRQGKDSAHIKATASFCAVGINSSMFFSGFY